MREYTGIYVSTSMTSPLFSWMEIPRNQVTWWVYVKQDPPSTKRPKMKPQHTLYLVWSTAILPSSGDSLRRRCEEEERNHEMPGFSYGPDPQLPPIGRSEEFKLSWAFLVPGKKSAVQDQNLSWHHTLTTGTHTVTLAHLRAPSNRTHNATKLH